MHKLQVGMVNLRATHRILFPLVIAILVLVMLGGVVVVAAASFSLKVPSTVNVTGYVPPGGLGGAEGDPEYAFAVYTDEGHNNRLTTSSNYSWGSVPKGGNVQRTFYIKNIGIRDIGSVSISLDQVPSGINLGGQTGLIHPNESVALSATLMIDASATPANVNLYTVFYADPPPPAN